MIKKLMATALVAGATLFAAPVSANDCVMSNGYEVCSDLISRNGAFNRWSVVFRNSFTTEYMTVTCYGLEVSDWESRGGLSQVEADNLAEWWCSL
jgi:hypothetical protein